MTSPKIDKFFIIGYRFAENGYGHIRYEADEEALFKQALDQIQSLFGKKAKVQLGEVADKRGLVILDMSTIIAVEARYVEQEILPMGLCQANNALQEAPAKTAAPEPEADTEGAGEYNP